MSSTETTLARQLWQFGEPLHAVTYFAPERQHHTDELGLKGGWMSYFGCRVAPLGSVAPAVASAVLYVFHPRMVERAIPDVWSIAGPDQLIDARLRAIDESLHRILGDAIDSPAIRRAAELARAASDRCAFAGRPLGAANAALPVADAAHLSLWQSLTTMREQRGDGHVAALVEAGVDPCEALVMQAATGRSDPAALQANRGWTDEEWAASVEALRARGWLDAAGAVTDSGNTARTSLEEATDRLAAPFVAGIGVDAAAELVDLLRPLAEAVMASGTVAPLNNMGLPWPPPAQA